MAKTPRGWGSINQATKRLSEQDRSARERQETDRETDSIAPVDIKMRKENTRPANPAHVLDLAESIAAVGLIEPVAIDRQNRLLAGLHRFHAATLLLTKGASDRQRYWEELCLAAELKGKPADHERIAGLPAPDKCHLTAGTIPVRRFDIDSSRSPSQALAIEVAENEKRRDYTKAEVQALRERLETAGYSFKRGPKPEGVKAGAPLLQSIVGKSRKTIERMQKNELTSDDVNSPKPEEALSRALKRFLKEAPDSNVVPLVEPLLAAIQGGKSTINVR